MRRVVPWIVVLLLAARSAGQTTRPVDAAWTRTVQQTATAIAGGDAVALAGMLSDDVAIRCVDGMDSRPADALRLLARLGRSRVVCALAYGGIPQHLAADIAEAIRDTDLPPETKELFALGDESHRRRANATAAQWLSETLNAAPESPVGLILLAPAEKTAPESSGAGGIVFVMLRGKGALPACQVDVIAFGAPILNLK